MENTSTDTYPDLKTWRTAKGFTQKEAAKFLGITQSHYSMLERRAVAPRGHLANHLIDKTGVSLKALLGAA